LYATDVTYYFEGIHHNYNYVHNCVCEIKLVEKTKERLPMKHEKGNIHDEYSQVVTARCPLASSRNKTDQ